MTKIDNLKVVKARPNVFISCGGCKSVTNNDSTCCNCAQSQSEKVESKTNIFLKHISEYLHKIGQGKPKQLRDTTYSVEKEDEFEYSKALRNVKLKCAPNCFGIKSKNSTSTSETKIIKDDLYKEQKNDQKLTKKDEQKCLHVNINFVNQVNFPGSCCCQCIKKGIKTNPECICNLKLQDDTLQTLIPAGLEGSGSQYCVVISPEGETTIFYQKHIGKGEKKKKLDKDRVIKSESEGSDEEKESSDEDVDGELDSKLGIRCDEQKKSISKSLTDLEGKDDTGSRIEGSQTGEKTSLLGKTSDAKEKDTDDIDETLSERSIRITKEGDETLEKDTDDIDETLSERAIRITKEGDETLEKDTDDIDETLSERAIRITKEGDETFFDSGLEKTSKESLDSKGNLRKTFDEIVSQEDKDRKDKKDDNLSDERHEGELTDEAYEKEIRSSEQKGDLTDEDRLAGEGELTDEYRESHKGEFVEENADDQRSDRLKDGRELEKTDDGDLGSSIEGERTTQSKRGSTEFSTGKVSEIYSLAIQSIESAKKNWTKDTEYLEKEVGSYLIKSMAEIGFVKPSYPVNYLGERLYKYRHNVDYRTNADAEKEDALCNKEIFELTEQKVRTFNTLKKHRHKPEVTVEEPPQENEEKDTEIPTESDGKEEETENENNIVTESSIENANVVSEQENEDTAESNIE